MESKPTDVRDDKRVGKKSESDVELGASPVTALGVVLSRQEQESVKKSIGEYDICVRATGQTNLNLGVGLQAEPLRNGAAFIAQHKRGSSG